METRTGCLHSFYGQFLGTCQQGNQVILYFTGYLGLNLSAKVFEFNVGIYIVKLDIQIITKLEIGNLVALAITII